jgi:archaellum component FlaC
MKKLVTLHLELIEKLTNQVDDLLTDLYDNGQAESPETGEIRSDINELEKTLVKVRMELGS